MTGDVASRGARSLRFAGVVGPVARLVATRSLIAVGAGLGAAALGARTEAATDTGGAVDAAAAWLRVPMFLVAVTAVVTTIESWPGFGRDRGAAAAWVLRARLQPVRGTATAAGTGLLIAACALIATALLFENWVRGGQDRPIRAVETLDGPETSVLGAGVTVTLGVPEDSRGRPNTTLEVRARPAFFRGGSLATPPVEVLTADQRLGSITFPDGGGLGRLTLPVGAPAALTLRTVPGSPGFAVLGRGAVQVVREVGRSPRTNAIMTALTAAVPLAAALGLAVLLHAVLGRATLLLSAAGVVLLGFASSASGVPSALAAYARAEQVDPFPFPATRAPDRSPG